jgi:YHS domain-containing protein
MNSKVIVTMALAMVLVTGVAARADEKAPAAPEIKRQTTCPVMEGEKIDKNLYVDHEGKRLYVCCKGCIKEVSKDPAKWFKKVEDAGITLDKVQVNCPVTGDKIDKKVFADYEGKRVYFCCAACQEKFNADAKAIVAKMEAEGIVLDKAPEKKEKKEKK